MIGESKRGNKYLQFFKINDISFCTKGHFSVINIPIDVTKRNFWQAETNVIRHCNFKVSDQLTCMQKNTRWNFELFSLEVEKQYSHRCFQGLFIQLYYPMMQHLYFFDVIPQNNSDCFISLTYNRLQRWATQGLS